MAQSLARIYVRRIALASAGSNMKRCHPLVALGVVSGALLACFAPHILMRDPFWLSQNTSAVATFPLNRIFMGAGGVILIGLVWLRVIVVRANVLVRKLTTLNDKSILVNVRTSILPLMIPLGCTDCGGFTLILRTLLVLDFVCRYSGGQMPLLNISDFLTVIKATAEVLAHHELFIGFREILFLLLALRHVGSGLLRLSMNAKIAFEVGAAISSIMMRLHFDHLSKICLIQGLRNVFGFLYRGGALRCLFIFAIINHIFLSILIAAVGDLRPITFVRLLSELPIFVLV